MQAIGVIGVLAAFVFLFYFSYKGANLAYLSIFACIIIIVTNRMPLLRTFSDVILPGVEMLAASLLLIYLCGAILGSLYVNSGAANAIATGLMHTLGKKASPAGRQTIGILIAYIIGAVLTYCGIDNFSVIFTMIAIVSGIMRETNIPRRYLPVLLISPYAVGALMPGTLEVGSLMVGEILQVKTSAGVIPGILGTVFLFVCSICYLKKLIAKDMAKGAGWQELENQGAPSIAEGGKGPHALVSALPLVAIVLTYNLFHLEAYAAIMVGIVVAGVLFFPYLKAPASYKGNNAFFGKMYGLMDAMNQGAANAGIPSVMLISFGLASCIQASSAYTAISDFFVSIPLPAAISLALVSTVLVGASCGPAGLLVAGMLAVNTFIPNGMITAAAAFRIIVATALVLDTMPCCPGPASIMMLTGIEQKEGYPPVGMTTVLFTGLAVVLITVLFIIFPNLA